MTILTKLLSWAKPWAKTKNDPSANFAFDVGGDKHRDRVAVAAATATLALAYLATYMPLLVDIGLIAGVISLAIIAYKLKYHALPMAVVATLTAFYTALIQPDISLVLLPIAFGIAVGRLLVGRVSEKAAGGRLTWLNIRGDLSVWTKAAMRIVVFIASAAVMEALFLTVYEVIPAIQPVLYKAWLALPIAWVLAAIAITWYCTARRKKSKAKIYALAPGMMAFGFVLIFPWHAPTLTWAGMLTVPVIIQLTFAFPALVLGFASPKLLRLYGIAGAVAFAAMFAIPQVSPWANKTATGYSIPFSDKKTVTTTTVRLIPYDLGKNTCEAGNNLNETKTLPVTVSVIHGRFMYQCVAEYEGTVWNDLVRSFLRTTAGVIRIDASSFAATARLEPSKHWWVPDGRIYEAVMVLRNPGSRPGNLALMGEQDNALVQSYLRPRLWYGAWIQAVGGSVVQDTWGGFRNLTVAQAASQFPNFTQVPGWLVRDWTEIFATHDTPWQSRFGYNIVSEVGTGVGGLEETTGNHPPYLTQVDNEMSWTISLEAKGGNRKAMKAVLFFSGYTGELTRFSFGGNDIVKGLEDIRHMAASQANRPNSYGLEPVAYVHDNALYFVTAIMGGNTKQGNMDFLGVVVSTGQGAPVSLEGVILRSTQEVVAAIESYKGAKVLLKAQ